MAKRKRLGGPLESYLSTSAPVSDTSAAAAPIARVAGEASINAAFDEVSRELQAARSEGRLLQRLPLDSIETTWLVRDRTHPGGADDPDFAALLDSLRRNGQRHPIEVTELGQGRYGLISGWRRVSALGHLHAETGEARFATVLAVLRRPASSEDAYIAMVEENEVRLGLSYYERARIAAKSVEAGVYPTPKAALQSLFASASRAKRSKIGSFLALHDVLGDLVRFPQALTERTGLALVKILNADEAAKARLRHRLETAPAEGPEAEQDVFRAFIETESADDSSRPPVSQDGSKGRRATRAADGKTGPNTPRNEVRTGVFLQQTGDKLQLSGPAVNAEFRVRLETWLRQDMAE